MQSRRVFPREKTETLKVVQTMKKEHLGGSTALRLSRDGNLAAASSFRLYLLLYGRDPDTGLLTSADIVSAREPVDVRLLYPIDRSFSPDG